MKHLILLSVTLYAHNIMCASSGNHPDLFSWRIAKKPCQKASVSHAPLLSLNDEIFTCAECECLYMRSVTLGEYSFKDPGHALLTKHPTYLFNEETPDASSVPEAGPAEHPGYIVIPQPETPMETASGLTMMHKPLAKAIPVSQRRESPIVDCTKHNDLLASVSDWHIVLSDLSSGKNTVIEHNRPLVFPLDCRRPISAPFGKFGSNNFITSVALAEQLLTGHFDGSLMLKDLPTHETVAVVPSLLEPDFTNASAIKKLFFVNDSVAYLLTKKFIQRMDVRKKVHMNIMELKMSKPHYLTTLCRGGEHELFTGTQDGSLYRIDARAKDYEFIADISRPDKDDKAISALSYSKNLIFIGTQLGSLYTYNPKLNKVCRYETDIAAGITSLLPQKRCLIYSTDQGDLRCMPTDS